MGAVSNQEVSELVTAQLPDTIRQDSMTESISVKELKSKEISYGSKNEELTEPTEEELASLRRVSGNIPYTAFWIAFIELCERFSYYGTTAVCKSFRNFSCIKN